MPSFLTFRRKWCLRDTPKDIYDPDGPRRIGQPGVPWSKTWYCWKSGSDQSDLTTCNEHSVGACCSALANGIWPKPTVIMEDRRLFELKDIKTAMFRANGHVVQGDGDDDGSGSVSGPSHAGSNDFELVSGGIVVGPGAGDDAGPPPATVSLWSRAKSRRAFYLRGKPIYTGGHDGPLAWELQLYDQQEKARRSSEDAAI